MTCDICCLFYRCVVCLLKIAIATESIFTFSRSTMTFTCVKLNCIWTEASESSTRAMKSQTCSKDCCLSTRSAPCLPEIAFVTVIVCYILIVHVMSCFQENFQLTHTSYWKNLTMLDIRGGPFHFWGAGEGEWFWIKYLASSCTKTRSLPEKIHAVRIRSVSRKKACSTQKKALCILTSRVEIFLCMKGRAKRNRTCTKWPIHPQKSNARSKRKNSK